MSITYKIMIATLIAGIGIIQCTSPQKIRYEFPVAMKEPVRVEYEKLCEKGKILYQINCGCCHNKKVRGKEVIPDFTASEIETYTIRILNPQHEKGLQEERMTAEELGLITTFLTYKRKNKSK